MRCEYCKYYSGIDRRCHRHAPVLVGENETDFPYMSPDNGCGDFEKKVSLRELIAEEKLWSAIRRKVLGLV